jgi:signal transduction histidine kinase
LFALLIAAPALALAWMGLRAVGAERVEAEQRLREQQRQVTQLADATIVNELTQREATLAKVPDIRFHRSGLVVFPKDRVYFGPFGQVPAERGHLVERSDAVATLIDQAQAAESRGNVADAIRLFQRVAGMDPKLEAWATIASARAEVLTRAGALARLVDVRWAVSAGVTPSGLPAAFIACAASESRPAGDRPRFAPLIAATLQGLHEGRWWLSADERRFYDRELRSLLEKAGGAVSRADARFAEVEAIEQIVRQSPPSRRNAPTRTIERGSGGTMLVLWIPSTTQPDVWMGGASTMESAGSFLGPSLGRLFAGQPFTGGLRQSGGGIIWTNGADAPVWRSEPLATIPGWEMVFSGPAAHPAFARQQWLWYSFVSLLLVMMLAGLGMTAHVVRREMELGRMQSEFLGAVTHEFKSPLTSIRLLLERVTGGRVVSPEAARTYYSAIGQETDRLERLVNRLLEAQQIEAGHRQYAFTSESLESVAQEVVAHLAPIAEARGIRIDIQVEGDTPSVRIDRAAIADAIENLVENAIKYSRNGTRVALRIHADGERVCVEVADQGIGIERDELSRIFDKFYRARRGDLQSVRGTGLGLALVKAAAEAHGGVVDVESEPGVGSRFSLKLPA